MEQPLSVPSPLKPAGVMIADDHQLFSDGLQVMLNAAPDLQVLHRVFNGNEVLHAVQMYQPSILLLDINMPGKDGLTLAFELKRDFKQLKIILLSMYSDLHFIARAKEAGVEGYLLKTTSGNELLNAIRKVLGGDTCYLNKGPEAMHAHDPFMIKYKLTPREREIIALLKQGLSNQEIADRIFLSVFTVETHRRNINLKLGVKKPAELILKAIELGL